MGCGSCGSKSASGKPSGCQSNGGCSSGGCNRLNVFNWLSDLPLSEFGTQYPIVEISFNKGSRKDFFRSNGAHIYEKGMWASVEGAGGFDVGEVSLTGELVKLQMKKYGVTENSELKRILRPATDKDIELFQTNKGKEKEALIKSRVIARQLNLEMKIAEVEFQADAKKVCFYYTADARVDFRELIKVFAAEFRAKVEMRQIGARQESGKVGGIGSCGRELCCSTWLTDFKTVNTTAARYQNLSINQTKLSGQCGRLKCCLNYELDTYMDALHSFPENADQLEVASGKAYLQKKDIFRNLMWYSFSGSSKQYPLTIERVQEIVALNASGSKPENLDAVEIQVRHKDPEKTVDMGFVNDVGQLTLSSLSRASKRKQNAQQGKAKAGPSKGNGPKPGQPQQPGAPKGQPRNAQGGGRPPRPQQAGNAPGTQPQPTGSGAATSPKPQQQRGQGQGGQQRPKQERDPNKKNQPAVKEARENKQGPHSPAPQQGTDNARAQQKPRPQQQKKRPPRPKGDAAGGPRDGAANNEP